MSEIRNQVRHFYADAPDEVSKLVGRKLDPRGSFQVSEEWTSSGPKSEEEYLEFYRNINYIDELAYNNRKFKIHSSVKLIEAMHRYGGSDIKSVLDFGGGIGSDSLALATLGYQTYFYDINTRSVDLFKKRMELHKISVPILDDWRKYSPYDCIFHVEVIAHMHDPLQFVTDLASHCRWMAFTVDLGIHDEREGGHSQHSDVPRSHLWKHLNKLGFQKVKLEGVAMPPQLWRKV